MSDTLRAPFPYFGGKRRVADVVWRAFGPDIANYVEPFAGSLAVLLARPGGPGKIETVNDIDRMVANFWRAVDAEPDEVARWADHPVNEADLHARHKWLVNQTEFRERMHSDPDFYDVKIAGWWVWGICQWIGGGWCVEPQNHKHPKLDGIGKGVHSDSAHPRSRELRSKTRPKMSADSAGMGVHRPLRSRDSQWRKRPELDGTSAGRGVHSDAAFPKEQLPDLAVTTRNGMAAGRGVHSSSAHQKIFAGDTRRGVHAQSQAYSPGRRPSIGNTGQGVHLPSLGNDRGLNGVAAAPCIEWFRELQARLRRVRVACGDWMRVLGPSVLGKGKNVGGRRPCAVFLDPPYSFDLRARYLYAEDDAAISTRVRQWAIEHGDDPELRICLAGYWDEHREHMPSTWSSHRWKAARGYAGAENDNREQETLWFSPHCLSIEEIAPRQASLFAMEAAAQ